MISAISHIALVVIFSHQGPGAEYVSHHNHDILVLMRFCQWTVKHPHSQAARRCPTRAFPKNGRAIDTALNPYSLTGPCDSELCHH
ncbi:hypothetical protein BDR07DRAFT_1058044 [Suillus spraguei]|nr:hypothetical protein BDR07DRAFT_1058044 [Suillus spraguei]